jgi:hypothetical protein
LKARIVRDNNDLCDCSSCHFITLPAISTC